ncbi:MAG: hypothetical protein D6726_12215 [Nitrospirae bacterium]|nr:MAG: hypothetical protein D6726_12215 [Nitrospirota bacterium]
MSRKQTKRDPEKTRKAIKYYLSQGLSIIPLKGKTYSTNEKESKTPLLTWSKYQKKQATEKEAMKWFENWPMMNIGIVTGQVSGIVVVDLDSNEAMKMAEKNGLLDTAVVRTGKGAHAYFRYPEGKRITNTVRLNGLEIDIRGDGGYVVAPPSLHWNGNEYRWLKGKELWKKDLAMLPESLVETISKPGNGNGNGSGLKPLYGGVDAGQRNDSLARLVGSWLYDGLSYEECLRMAELWNKNNRPPMSDREVRAVVESIWKKHQECKQIIDPELKKTLTYEKNLFYLPLFVHNRRLIHKAETVVYEKETNEVKRRWEVHGVSDWGLPGPFDEAVFFAICMLIEKNNLPARNPFPVGSIKEIARTMGIPDTGKNLSLIKKSLKRLVAVTLVSDHTFYNAEKKQRVTDVFHLWDRVVFKGEELDKNKKADSTLIWMSEVVLNNFRNKYLSHLNYEKYISLKTYIARGIFRIIYPILEREGKVTIKYSTLQQRLLFNRENQISKIKQQLEQPHAELKNKGIVNKIKITPIEDKTPTEVFITYSI